MAEEPVKAAILIVGLLTIAFVLAIPIVIVFAMIWAAISR